MIDTGALIGVIPDDVTSSVDAYVAAHAIVAGVPLLTADRGFIRFDDLDIRYV